MEAVEEKELELSAGIYASELQKLIELAEHLEIVVKEGSRKLEVAKTVIGGVQERVVKLEDSQAKSKFLDELLGLLKGEMPGLEDGKVSEEADGAEKSTGEQKSPKVSVQLDKFKKDFKIHGTVGADSSKDSLTFISIDRQINSGLASGYTENEIVEAVIRAVSQNSKLRSYLEMQSDLSLSRLKQLLRAHFKQKSGTALYQELSVMCQDVSESPQDFLIRAMNLRQQVILSSKQHDGAIKYDPSLVQALFRHVVETGLLDESVRAKLRPLLENPNVKDEELMERANVAVSAETERFNKMHGGPKKSPKVNEIAQTVNKQKPQNVDPKEAKTNKLMATLEAVQSDLTYLKGWVDKSQATANANNNSNARQENNGPPTGVNHRSRRRCDKCVEGNIENCEHCFKCGSSEHFARGCRVARASGNGRRLQQRGRP